MSDISNVSSRSGQSATANPSTTGYSPLAQNVEDAASAPAGANQLNRSGALGRDATEKLTGALNKQVSAGSAFLEEASESLRAAAAKLDERLSPLAHGLRRAARAGDDFAEQVRTRSPGELLNASSEYARQRPMLVFGVAAGVGLLLSRFAKSTRPTSASPTSDWGQTRAQSAQMSLQTRGVQPPEHQFPDALMPDWTS
jgi:ElaB/YqjD/DUF883 family membrane-anchored ribosome-binding protein